MGGPPGRKARVVSTQAPAGISPAGEKAIRRIASSTVVAIAIAAAVLSFTGLRQLALTAGFAPELAWLFPLIVDGLTLIGSLGVVHATLTGMRVWFPWTLTLTGVGLSVWGNIAAADPAVLSRLVHAVPPVVLALSLEALLRTYRYRLTHTDPAQGSAPESHEPAQEHKPTRTAPRESESVTADIPAAIPAPAAAPSLVPVAPGAVSVREQLTHLLADDPDITPSAAARALGKDRSNVSKILKELRAQADTNADTAEQVAA